MRNRTPEVTEAAVIEDFYRGFNDSAFVQAIMQKAPTTSEQLFREADLYITADEWPQDLIRGEKPASSAPRRDANQHPDKRWDKRPREEVHAAGPPVSRARGAPRGGERTLDDILNAQCLYHKDMRHTLRNCRAFKHFPSGMVDRSNLYHLPHHEEGLASLGGLNNRKGEEVEHSRASTGRSTSSSEDTGRRRTKGNISSTTDRYWRQPPVPPPPIGGQNTRSPLPRRINGSTSIIRANTHSSLIR
jgi:hypothetical protein